MIHIRTCTVYAYIDESINVHVPETMGALHACVFRLNVTSGQHTTTCTCIYMYVCVVYNHRELECEIVFFYCNLLYARPLSYPHIYTPIIVCSLAERNCIDLYSPTSLRMPYYFEL